jgi:hypothetical protein
MVVGDTTMSDQEKARQIRKLPRQIRKLPRQLQELPRAPEELTPQEVEKAQGGGSATGGAGPGKFNEFQIKKTSDR